MNEQKDSLGRASSVPPPGSGRSRKAIEEAGNGLPMKTPVLKPDEGEQFDLTRRARK